MDYGYKKGYKPWNTGIISGLYVGQVIESNNYGKFEIIGIVDNFTVYHKFIKTGWVGKATACKTRIGDVKDYRLPDIYGVGYNTLGKMPLKRTNKKMLSAKSKWLDMLNRCYGNNNRMPTYKKCSVSEEWHDFANFWCWYDKVCDVDDKTSFHLDKDLLVKGNTLYSKDTCCLVPRKINNVLVSKISNKNTDLPVGIHFHERRSKYQTYCNDFSGKRHSLGYYLTQEEAYTVYKSFKQKVLEEAANFYKDMIDERLYNVLINYDFNRRDNDK